MRYFTTTIAILTIFIVSIFSISCHKRKEIDTGKIAEKEQQGIKVEYHPKPAVKDSALSFKVYLPFNARKVMLELRPNGNREEKKIILKKINPKEFAGVVIPFESGVYKVRLSVTDEKSAVKSFEKGLPLIHVTSKDEKKKTDMDLIVEYLKDYYSLLPSSYREIKLIESEIVAKRGNRILYRVIFEAKKYEEGRLKETETLFFIINKEAGIPYIEYVEKNPPPSFN